MPMSCWTMAGFTLVEMLVVLVIVATLASIAMPMAELASRRAKEDELRTDLRTIRDALDAYKRAVDEGHIARNAIDSGFPPNLGVLVSGVEDSRSPTRSQLYFLRNLPRDPFAEDDGESASATWATRAYASSPSDPRPGNDVYDVHSKSLETGLNGQPYTLW
jgi:general secretion pathway protein G